MCGIVACVGVENTKGTLLDGLSRLEYRGYDSAGVALAKEDGSLLTLKSRLSPQPSPCNSSHTTSPTNAGARSTSRAI